MSLHDVVIELLYGGFPKSEPDRDRLIEAVRQDQAAQVERDRPVVLPTSVDPEPAPVKGPDDLSERPVFDPATGARLK